MKRIAGILLLVFVSIIKLHAQCAISGSLNICVGSTSQLTGENPPAEGNPWSSSAPEVATVSATGLVTGISAGSCTITYTNTACSSSVTINVSANTIPNFNQPGPYCIGANPDALPLTSLNGITGTWYPSTISTATPGSTDYTFTPDAGFCSSTVTITVVVNENTIVPLFTQPGPYCAGASMPALPTISNNNIAGTWNPSVIDNNASATYTFTPLAGQCAVSTTLTITINPIVTPSFNVPGPYCAGASIPALPTTSINGITGTWSPAINNNATTTYTFTPTSGQCATTASLTITINPNTVPTFNSVGPYCAGASIPALPTISTNGVTGTWSPAINNTATTTYTFTPSAGQCALTTNITITINPVPSPPIPGSATQPTCTVSTGSVPLSGLPASGTWTVTRTPGNVASSGSGTSTTISGIPPGTYTFTVTNSSGCISASSGSVTINSQPVTPSSPVVGTITHPTCSVPTGSVPLSGLPSSGTWTVTMSPGSVTSSGSGTTTTITGVPAGSFTFTVTNSSGCTSAPSSAAILNSQPLTPSVPVVGTIVQPSCTIATGSVPLSGLPSSGTWILTRSPGGVTTTGSGTTTTITGLAAGTYTFTVTNSSGCTSISTSGITINQQPVTPSAPVTGTATQPTCSVATGSVPLTGLPSSGTWTVTRMPGSVTSTGSGTTATISGIAAGTYTFTVTNASGCISAASTGVTINEQPVTPVAPVAGSTIQPTCTVATGTITLNNLPSSGTWTLTRTPGSITTTGTGISTTIAGLPAGTYTYTVTNAAGCTSLASAGITIDPQPVTPSAPVPGTISQPTCTVATGSIPLTGLPSSGTWTLTRVPGNVTTTGSGIATTIAGLTTGVYSFTVTNSSGCTSASSPDVTISAQPVTPSAPLIGTITQPSCTVATGAAALSGLPATGNWIITRTPGGVTTNGSGTTTAVSGLPAGTYSFTVTNSVGCTSSASQNVVINIQPPTPSAPLPGTLIQPSLDNPLGSIVVNGLPSTGTWTLHRQPGGISTSGTGTSTTVSGIEPGSYTFTVTNSAGCTSAPTAAIGFYLLKLYGPDNKIIRSKDTIKIASPEAGSFTFRVESNSDWKVADNALWFKAVKESPTSIKVTYSENISVKDKTSSLFVTYTSNPEITINIRQQGRISQLKESKLTNAKLYPNPAGDFLYLSHGNADLEKIVVTIADIQGHVLMVRNYERISSGEVTEINVSHLPVGQFLFNITVGSDSRTFQFIKY